MELNEIAARVLSPLGYEVLETSLKPVGRRRVLTVRIERKDEVPVAVSDLEDANRALSAELDRLDSATGEEVIKGAYLLEVESPGAERPLLSLRHFERFIGLKVKVRSESGNFTGRVQMIRPEQDEVDFLMAEGDTRTLKLGSFKANLAEWPDSPR